MECIMCGIVSGEIPSFKYYESKNFVVVLDIKPANPGHSIIIPKKHYQFFQQMNNEELHELIELIKLVSLAILDVTKAQGLVILHREGKEFPHATFHIIPRFEGDEVMIGWKPKEIKEGDLKQLQAILSQYSQAWKIASDKKEEKKKEEKIVKKEKPIFKNIRIP